MLLTSLPALSFSTAASPPLFPPPKLPTMMTTASLISSPPSSSPSRPHRPLTSPPYPPPSSTASSSSSGTMPPARSSSSAPSSPPPSPPSPSSLDLAACSRDRKTLTLILNILRQLSLPLNPPEPSPSSPSASSPKASPMARSDSSSSSTITAAILDVLAKSGWVEKAYSLFRALRGRFGVDTVSYNIIAEGWCRVEGTARAMEVMEEMVELGLELSLSILVDAASIILLPRPHLWKCT